MHAWIFSTYYFFDRSFTTIIMAFQPYFPVDTGRRSEDVQDVFWTSYVHSIYVLCLRGLRLFHGVLSVLRKLFLNKFSLIFLCFFFYFQESSAEVVIHTCKKIHISKVILKLHPTNTLQKITLHFVVEVIL